MFRYQISFVYVSMGAWLKKEREERERERGRYLRQRLFFLFSSE